MTNAKAAMRVPNSNSTSDGARDATQWLENHREVLPRLRRVFRHYYKNSGRDFPWRRTRDPYKILVAEILLQKTGVGPVEDVWTEFIQCWPDPEALAAASIDDLEATIRSLGLHHKRARALRATGRRVLREAGGKIVRDPEFLRSLRGVGAYTVAAILSFAYKVRVPVIDVNAARVYARIGGFSPNTLRQGIAFAEVVGELVVTEKTHREVNYGVLDLAAQVCKTRPLCSKCPALGVCEYAQEQLGKIEQCS